MMNLERTNIFRNSKLYYLSFGIMILLFFSGCFDEIVCLKGKGPILTEERSIKSFTKVFSQIDADIYITQSDTQQVIIEGQENVLDQIQTYVSDGILRIDYDQCIRDHDGVNIYLSMNQVNGLKMGGSGKIVAQNHIITDLMEFKISGSGYIQVDSLQVQNIDTHISGSGDVIIGSADIADYHLIQITGSGNVLSYDIVVRAAEILISGSGNCELHVTSTLDVEIPGSGNVYYRGNPSVSQNITGSGTIQKTD